MAIFKINKAQARKVLGTKFEDYICSSYEYYKNHKFPENEVKVVIEKEYITIHITIYYYIICNDLKFLNNQGLITASKRSLNWLKKYEQKILS